MHSWGVGGLNSIYRYPMCCVVFISVHVRMFQCGLIDRGSFGGRQRVIISRACPRERREAAPCKFQAPGNTLFIDIKPYCSALLPLWRFAGWSLLPVYDCVNFPL